MEPSVGSGMIPGLPRVPLRWHRRRSGGLFSREGAIALRPLPREGGHSQPVPAALPPLFARFSARRIREPSLRAAWVASTATARAPRDDRSFWPLAGRGRDRNELRECAPVQFRLRSQPPRRPFSRNRRGRVGCTSIALSGGGSHRPPPPRDLRWSGPRGSLPRVLADGGTMSTSREVPPASRIPRARRRGASARPRSDRCVVDGCMAEPGSE